MSGAVQKKYALLTPKVVPPRLDSLSIYTNVKNPRDLDWIVLERLSSEPLALDFETRGNEPANPDHGPVGVAFADSRGSCYIDLQSSPGSYEYLMRLLHEHRVPLLAHNVFFDASWPLRDFGLWLNWAACTYAAYKLTAREGFQQQAWGLKAAQLDMLGWTETNEDALDRWLIDNGWYQSVSKEPKEGYYLYPEWLVAGKPEPRYVSPNKGEMWRAPPDVIGHYAALDADACWLLWTEVLRPCIGRFEFLRELVYEWYPRYLEILVRQKLRGVLIDRPRLERYRDTLQREERELTQEFLSRPEVAPHVAAFNAQVVEEVRAKEPEQFKKVKERKEPARFLKDGVTVSKNWAKWKAWSESEESRPQVSLNWLKWKERLQEAEKGQHFNIGSGPQLAWLLYEKLGYPVQIYTDTGAPATSGDALLGMGELGKTLLEIESRNKLAQFCTIVLDLLTPEDTLHPGFRVPGTLTGRLAGNRPNLQNQPKSLEYLDCFIARPGYKLITCDVVSLENYVLAELSKDKALWGLYGPDARPGQDAYLYNAAQLPVIGPRIRATGYDPHTATAEQTKKAKKECKADRPVGKVLTLMKNYRAGVPKIHATLKLQGVDVTLTQVEEMSRAFDELYSGILEWSRELERQWKKNGGWVFNGLGEPLGVDATLTKDLVNRVCQSTGHTAFMKWLLIVADLLDEAGVEWHPWIADLHDCGIFEVREDQVELAKRIMEKDAYEKLNEWLGGEIRLKGEAKVCDTWADDKRE